MSAFRSKNRRVGFSNEKCSPVQETKDREWQKVEAKKTKRKKNKEMKGPKEKEQTKQRSRRLRPCALVIKPTEGKVC